MPRGVPHRMELLTETIHALILISPAGFERYFWQISQPATDAEIPLLSDAPLSPETRERMFNLSRAYGLKPAP